MQPPTERGSRFAPQTDDEREAYRQYQLDCERCPYVDTELEAMWRKYVRKIKQLRGE